LSEHLPELPQLQKTRIGIFREVTFGQHPKPHELLVVRPQKPKIGG
jgi:hypothetical protein